MPTFVHGPFSTVPWSAVGHTQVPPEQTREAPPEEAQAVSAPGERQPCASAVQIATPPFGPQTVWLLFWQKAFVGHVQTPAPWQV